MPGTQALLFRLGPTLGEDALRVARALLPPAPLGVTAIRLAWSDAFPGQEAPIPASPPSPSPAPAAPQP